MSAAMLKPAEVAERLQFEERTVRMWLKTGKLRGHKLGRVWRVPVEAVEAFLNEPTGERAGK